MRQIFWKKQTFVRKNKIKFYKLDPLYWNFNQRERMTITSNQHKLVVSHKVERLHITGTIRRLCIRIREPKHRKLIQKSILVKQIIPADPRYVSVCVFESIGKELKNKAEEKK